MSISTQSSLFLAKYNNLLCFFFLNFVSCCNFLIIPELRHDIKEKTEVIKPSDCFLPLTWAKMFTPEKKVKYTVKILSV